MLDIDILFSITIKYVFSLFSVAMDSVASRLVTVDRNAFQLEETKVCYPYFCRSGHNIVLIATTVSCSRFSAISLLATGEWEISLITSACAATMQFILNVKKSDFRNLTLLS